MGRHVLNVSGIILLAWVLDQMERRTQLSTPISLFPVWIHRDWISRCLGPHSPHHGRLCSQTVSQNQPFPVSTVLARYYATARRQMTNLVWWLLRVCTRGVWFQKESGNWQPGRVPTLHHPLAGFCLAERNFCSRMLFIRNGSK